MAEILIVDDDANFAEQIRAELTVKEQTHHGLEELLRLPFHASVAEWERRLIGRALAEAEGNKAEAARRLGIHRRLLYEKLAGLGMSGRDAGRDRDGTE